MYPGKKNAVPFKIDCRFVHDYNGQEYDLGAGELSKHDPGDDKLFGDEGKLIREGKEVVDGLAYTLCGSLSDQEFKGWLLQLNGTCDRISSFFTSSVDIGLYCFNNSKKNPFRAQW